MTATEGLLRRTSFWPLIILLATSALSACAVNRPLALPPGPSALADYLTAHHPADILVTDSGGRSQMVHSPRVDGDTLRGLRNRELPRLAFSMPLTNVRKLAVPEFSAGRTLGLTGGILAASAIGILILANGSKPVY